VAANARFLDRRDFESVTSNSKLSYCAPIRLLNIMETFDRSLLSEMVLLQRERPSFLFSGTVFSQQGEKQMQMQMQMRQ